MSDLDVLNRLSRELEEARESARVERERADTAETELSRLRSAARRVDKAEKARDVAIRERKAAERQADVTRRELDAARKEASRMQNAYNALQSAAEGAHERYKEDLSELQEALKQANLLVRKYEADSRAQRLKMEELEAAQTALDSLQRALRPLVK